MNAGPFVSPEEIVARLVQIGLFDKAVDTALRFELPLDSIFEALASRLWFYMLIGICSLFPRLHPTVSYTIGTVTAQLHKYIIHGIYNFGMQS